MKTIYASLTEIPEALRSEYVKQDDKFVLKIEGEHPLFVPLTTHEELKTRLGEFRQNNIGLNTAVTELTGKLKLFGDIAPEAVTAMKTKLQEFENKGAKTPDDIQARIDSALNPVLEELKAARTLSENLAKESKIERRKSSLVQVAAKLGVREEAIPDFLARGNSIFNEDGVPVRDGKEVMSPRDPSRTMNFEEYAASLKTEAPHLFKPSGGGGAQPGAGSPTKQIISSDPLEHGRNLEAIAKGEVIVAT